MPNNTPQQLGLESYRAKRKKNTFDSIRNAIQSLKKQRKVININSVAKEANISNVTIYKYPELIDEINIAKGQKSAKQRKSMKSANMAQMQVIIDGLEMRAEELQKENNWLKKRIEVQNGEIQELRKANHK